MVQTSLCIVPRHGGGYETLGEKEVEAKYGIPTPAQVVDLLALMGDSADNFPGCPGVGEKTAAKLINQFGSIENMLQHTDEIKGKLRDKVENAIEDIKMSKFLATIRTDVPIQLQLDELKLEQPDEGKLRAIFEELEFKTLINKFLNKSEAKQKSEEKQLDLFAINTPPIPEEPKTRNFESLKTTQYEYKLIENEDDARRICDFFRTKEFVSLDTETTSTDAISAELVGLSFSVEEKKAFYVAIPANREEALRYVQIFKPLYEDDKIMKIGQNIKYDYEVLSNYGVTLKGKMFDTMIAHYLIQPELHHNMDYMAETLLHYKTIHIEELLGPKGKKQKNMRDLSPADIYEYAAEDADITLRLKNVLEPKLKELSVERLFWDIEMPLVRVLADMELVVFVWTQMRCKKHQEFSLNVCLNMSKRYTKKQEKNSIYPARNKWVISFSARCRSWTSPRRPRLDNMSPAKRCYRASKQSTQSFVTSSITEV